VTGGINVAEDPDVRPAGDYLPAPSGSSPSFNSGFPFEKLLPGTRDGNGDADRGGIADYLAEARDGDGLDAAEYEDEWSQYLCAWGPMELASANAAGNFLAEPPFSGNADRNYPGPWGFFNGIDQPLSPRLFRMIVEAADGQGRLDEPVRTELVFAVPHETN